MTHPFSPCPRPQARPASFFGRFKFSIQFAHPSRPRLRFWIDDETRWLDNRQLASGGPTHSSRARLGRAPLIFNREVSHASARLLQASPFYVMIHSRKCSPLHHLNTSSVRWSPAHSSSLSAPPPLIGARSVTHEDWVLPV